MKSTFDIRALFKYRPFFSGDSSLADLIKKTLSSDNTYCKKFESKQILYKIRNKGETYFSFSIKFIYQ